MQLFYIMLSDGSGIYADETELYDIKKTFKYLGLDFKACLIEDKMYAIHWFDYIDDEWSTIWCTEDEFERSLEDVKNAEVEYYIKEYN